MVSQDKSQVSTVLKDLKIALYPKAVKSPAKKHQLYLTGKFKTGQVTNWEQWAWRKMGGSTFGRRRRIPTISEAPITS